MNTKTFYDENGFALVREPVVPFAVVERAVAAQELLRFGGNDTGREHAGAYGDPQRSGALIKIEQPQLASHAIRELVSHPALGKWALEITGAEWVQPWWVQLLVKPSGDKLASNVGWHQDRYYRSDWEDGSELFTAWVALTDVTADAGPMVFLQGSHKWGFLNQGDFFGQDLDALKARINLPDGAAWDEVAGTLPQGGISFHHSLTFHGSSANISGVPRRSFAIHMRTNRSRPVDDRRSGLTTYIDNPEICPVFHR
jgi:hypothetical protein